MEAKKPQGLSNTPIGNPQPQQEVQFGQQPQINNNQQNLVQLLKNIKQKQSGITGAAEPVQQKQPVIQQIQQLRRFYR